MKNVERWSKESKVYEWKMDEDFWVIIEFPPWPYIGNPYREIEEIYEFNVKTLCCSGDDQQHAVAVMWKPKTLENKFYMPIWLYKKV